MAVLNSDILEKVWLEGSNAFQQRIPDPAIAGMDATVGAIFEPFNNDMYNEFSQLLNVIGNTYVRSKRFENPLRSLKKEASRFGATTQEVAVNYMQAHSFDSYDETLLKTEAPEYKSWFQTVNYKVRYEFSWQRAQLRQAFTGEGYGFNDLLAATLDAQISSDNYNEMVTMLQQFAYADKAWGLHREILTAAPTTKATGQELLAKVRTVAGKMRFPSTYYNAIDVPVFEDGSSLILWVTPEVDANLDVYTLSELFNVDRADVKYRKIIVPEFPFPDVYAALTSEDFIYFRDFEYGTYQFWNPSKLEDKFYLHHWAAVGANPAAMCVLFSTTADLTIPSSKLTVTGLKFADDTPTELPVNAKGTRLRVELEGSWAPDAGIPIEPDAATYTVSVTRAEQPVTRIGKTRVEPDGTLFIDQRALKAEDKLTITATAAYWNPSGTQPELEPVSKDITLKASTVADKGGVVGEKPYIEYTATNEVADA